MLGNQRMTNVLRAGPLRGQDRLDHFHFLRFSVFEKKVMKCQNGIIIEEQHSQIK